MEVLVKELKGVEVIRRCDKCYLFVLYYIEIIENKWGGSKNKLVEDIKGKIGNLLIEFVVSGDKKEVCRCIKELNVFFFYYEIIKCVLIMVMEKR